MEDLTHNIATKLAYNVQKPSVFRQYLKKNRKQIYLRVLKYFNIYFVIKRKLFSSGRWTERSLECTIKTQD